MTWKIICVYILVNERNPYMECNHLEDNKHKDKNWKTNLFGKIASTIWRVNTSLNYLMKKF